MKKSYIFFSLSFFITTYPMQQQPIDIRIRNGKIAAALQEVDRATVVMLNLKTDDCIVVCFPFKDRKLQRNGPIAASDITVKNLEEEIYRTVEIFGADVIHAYLQISH